MSYKRILGVVLLCCAFFASCNKEPRGMMLVAEGFGSPNKAAVDGIYSYWIQGEIVRINGVDRTITVYENRAYVEDVVETDTYRALYPNTLNPTADLKSNDVTVAIPSSYTYRTSDGRQALDVPMAAIGTSSTRLFFQHLTAAVTVTIINNFGIDLAVDSIVLSSNSYQISGDRDITLANAISIEPCTTDEAANKRVVVRFNGGTSLTVASGDTAKVQVPVLPVGDGNKFTIVVGAHNVDDAVMQYTFNKTQTTGGALLRAVLAYAPATFGGVFSVSATQKVRFAPGNLQYYCGGNDSYWRFAQHQYDYVTPFDGTAYATNNTNKMIDLFGFATSGIPTTTFLPHNNNPQDMIYVPGGGLMDITRTNYDWGWYNQITNGGNTVHRWRTLTQAEWSYLLNTRTNHSNLISLATVCSVKGMILLPDNFVAPSWFHVTTYNYNYSYAIDKWTILEAAGAIFLPENGYRDQTTRKNNTDGCYWTSTRNDDEYAYGLKFNTSVIKSDAKFSLHFGLSVRPVRDVVSN